MCNLRRAEWMTWEHRPGKAGASEHHPGPILGLCCVLKQTEMVLRCKWWALKVEIVSLCSISEHGVDACVVVCLEELTVCQAQVSCARWVGLVETCTINTAWNLELLIKTDCERRKFRCRKRSLQLYQHCFSTPWAGKHLLSLSISVP